jgi:hypothetical protein
MGNSTGNGARDGRRRWHDSLQGVAAVAGLRNSFARLRDRYAALPPTRALTLGFFSYVVAGTALLCLPFSRT